MFTEKKMIAYWLECAAYWSQRFADKADENDEREVKFAITSFHSCLALVEKNLLSLVEREIPSNDYEPCGECGFDHSYEQEEAQKAHKRDDSIPFVETDKL